MRQKQSFKNIFFLHFEWIVLACGLFLMAAMDPLGPGRTLCPLELAGFEFCPGSGLGRSISYAVRGNLHASLQMHAAGIFAVLILCSRIGSVLQRNHNLTNENHEKSI